jgi:hypothetical protein
VFDVGAVRFWHAVEQRQIERQRADAEARSQGRSNSRWSPTPEQLQRLEARFISGHGTTPSKPAIKEITEVLIEFGPITETNVYNWFQNRKVRDKKVSTAPPRRICMTSSSGSNRCLRFRRFMRVFCPPSAANELTVCVATAHLRAQARLKKQAEEEAAKRGAPPVPASGANPPPPNPSRLARYLAFASVASLA